MLLLLLLCTAFFCRHALALSNTIDLGYARYRGKTLENGVMLWAGMRYAKSPSRANGLRFAAPQDPTDQPGISDATSFGPLCIGSSSELTAEFGGAHSEDCLFINVFAPAQATTKSALPVYVFIQGGGFVMDANANYNGADLISAANNDIIVVNFNYRVGPYGFLAGSEIVANEAMSLNNGLKDQRQALKWVQEHIVKFGGNPGHVTLGGASAGGGSVVMQLTAYGGRDDKLFHAAAAESAAFPPLRDVPSSQWQYDLLLNQTGCADLACMATLPATTFQKAVRAVNKPFPGAKNPPIFFWNPTLDHDFIQDFTFNEIKAGHFVKVPVIFGDVTNEGIIFTPRDISSETAASQFVADQFPGIKWSDVTKVWNVSTAQSDPHWRQTAADIYGHIRYNCPVLNLSSAYANDKSATPVWVYRWNVGAATHVGELGSIWNNGTSEASVFVQAYWASFIRSYDPNKHVADYLATGGPAAKKLVSPHWEDFGTGDGTRMVFSDGNNVGMQAVPQLLRTRCDVITGMGLVLRHYEWNHYERYKQHEHDGTYA
ncbi:hypothetical protein ACEQ8H_005889 [Pleosporales sp. CAS-2024a]